MADREPQTYFLYVIELKGRDREVYVGYSAHTPEVRRRQHIDGKVGTPNGPARTFADDRSLVGPLLPDLYEHLNPIFVKNRNQAKWRERSLCRDLEAQGYKVHGDQTADAERRRA